MHFPTYSLSFCDFENYSSNFSIRLWRFTFYCFLLYGVPRCRADDVEEY